MTTIKYTAALLLGLSALPAAAQDTGLTVTGTGQVVASPDMARLSLGVLAQARTAAQAVRDMSADMEKVMASLTAAGVAQEDIQTSGLRVDVQQSYDEATQSSRITGYIAATDVSIQVLDLSKLGQTLDAVVQEGANQMNGLRFDLQDREPALNDARRAAVADALAKAALYAQAAGMALGPVQSLTEGVASSGTPQPMMRMAMDSTENVPVAAGQITISADVTVTWAFGE
jgi:uncharacterized protein YggE